MFGLSFTEILLVVIVGLLVLGPKELINTLRYLRSAWNSLLNVGRDFQETINDVTNSGKTDLFTDIKQHAKSLEDDIHYIVDQEGKSQETYSLDGIEDTSRTSLASEEKSEDNSDSTSKTKKI